MAANDPVGLLGLLLADPIVMSAAILMGGITIGGWLLAVIWCFVDSGRRSASYLGQCLAATWIVISGPLFVPISVAVYCLVRSADLPHDRQYQHLAQTIQTQAAEARSCFACGSQIDPSWNRCPTCASWLAVQCDRCARWHPPDAQICPWCAWEPVHAIEDRNAVPSPAGHGRATGRVAMEPRASNRAVLERLPKLG